jgi:hypothetical protein
MNTQSNERVANKDLPKNQEICVLLEVVQNSIKIFELQKANTTSQSEINGREKDIAQLNRIKKCLDSLSESESLDILLKKKKQELRNGGPTQEDALDDLEATIDFIQAERNKSSLEWSRRTLETQKQKIVIDNREAETDMRARENLETEELRDRILIQSVRNGSKGEIHMSLLPKYSPRNNSGFQTLSDPDWYEGRIFDPSIQEYMKKNKCPEVCRLQLLKKQLYKEEIIKPAEKGTFGIGKKDAVTQKVPKGTVTQKFSDFFPHSDISEDAYELQYFVDASNAKKGGLNIEEYQDYSGRGGQMIMMHLIIPASLANTVCAKLKKDPKFIRSIAEDQMRKYFERGGKGAIFQNVWDNGDNGDNAIKGIPLRPPYEKWEKQGAAVDFSEGEKVLF